MKNCLARRITRWWRINFKFNADNTNKNIINLIRDSIMINPLRLLPNVLETSWFGWNCKGIAERQAWWIGLLVVRLNHAADLSISYCCSLFDGWDENTGELE